MQRLGILAAICFASIVVASCDSNGGGALLEGDTVSPVWYGSLQWNTGGKADIAVRLQASGADNSGTRLLGFSAFPSGTAPKAVVTFYEDENEMPPVSVYLSHRC